MRELAFQAFIKLWQPRALQSHDHNQHMVHQPHHHPQVSAAHSTLLKVASALISR